MMVLRKNGRTGDIEVTVVSRLAREAKTTESEIISSLKSKGYSLMTPEEFLETLDYAKEAIKEGAS
jgi:hypothetical protein